MDASESASVGRDSNLTFGNFQLLVYWSHLLIFSYVYLSRAQTTLSQYFVHFRWLGDHMFRAATDR